MKPNLTKLFSVTLILLSGTASWNLFSPLANAQNPEQSQVPPQNARRLTLTEYEGRGNSSNWTFVSAKGYGKWQTGEEAVLELKSVQGDQVVIIRTDVAGAKAGFTATYKGTLHENRLGGEFSYEGRSESGSWYAIPEAAATSFPTVIHFCGANCFTLTWANGHYAITSPRNSWDPPDFTSTWTVETFTPQSVILHRHDSPNRANPASIPNGWDVVYRAKISPDGNRLVGVTLNGTPTPIIKVAWGDALTQVPGCNAERDGTGTCQQTPPPPGLVVGPGDKFVTDVLTGVAKDLIKDWIVSQFRNNQ